MVLLTDAARYAAINARIRALLTHLLPRHIWADLMQATTPTAYLDLLQRTPPYASLLPRDVSTQPPDHVERLLWGHAAAETRRPLVFLQGGQRDLVEWYWRRFEIHNLKAVLRAVDQGLPLNRIKERLIPLEGSRVPWDALAEVHSMADIIDRLAGTPYQSILQRAVGEYRRKGHVFVLEVALDLAYYRRLRNLANALRGRDGVEARRLIGLLVDAQNVLWAFRFRVYAHLSPEEILNYTLHRGVRVDVTLIQKIATGIPLVDVVRQIWGDRLGDLRPLSQVSEPRAVPMLERMLLRYAYRLARATLQGYPFHLGVVLGHAYLVEAEVRDLITLWAGLHAGWAPSRIRTALIRQ